MRSLQAVGCQSMGSRKLPRKQGKSSPGLYQLVNSSRDALALQLKVGKLVTFTPGILSFAFSS